MTEHPDVVTVRLLDPADRAEWERLFRGYIAFYERDEPQQMYDRAWDEFRTAERMHARVAVVDGRVVGIVHFLFHPSTTSRDVCYLQDLYVDEGARGHGVARRLIDTVADEARSRECDRVYWLTQTSNARARRLYDAVAEDRGFMMYRLRL